MYPVTQVEQFVSDPAQAVHFTLHAEQTVPFRKDSGAHVVQVSGTAASHEAQLELQQVEPF